MADADAGSCRKKNYGGRSLTPFLDNREELVRVKWMPSHLDDPKNSRKKEQALSCGLISEEEIEGKVQADKLADQGVKQHVCNMHRAAAGLDRI